MVRCELDATQLVQDLIRFETVSRECSNVEVTDFVEQILSDLSFVTERVNYEDEQGLKKSNVIGRAGPDGCGLAYFGHTDVVPAFNWRGPGGAFDPVVQDGKLYGRGSCDMKGSVACMLAAASQVDLHSLTAPLYITATADEEIGYGGARQVVQQSEFFREMVESQPRVIIGEPTRLAVVHAHKGTCGFIATSHGEAAHSSSHLGKNANLAMIPFLQELKAIHDETEADRQWHDDRFYPSGISWNIGVNDHTAAVNIKAPQSICTVYFRPVPGQDPQVLLDRAEAAAKANGLDFVQCPGSAPVFTDPDSEFIQDLLHQTGESESSTVCYGTDGGAFTELKKMAVLGPGDIAQAHTADEWIDLDQLEQGTRLYEKLIHHWCQP